MNTTKTWLARGLLALALIGCGTAANPSNPFFTSEDATMLPNSRNKTFDTTTPVDPTTLNDIQDCIIDAKHAEIEWNVGAPSFVLTTGSAADLITSRWENITTASGFAARVTQPAGTRITTIAYGYTRGAATMSLSLERIKIADGSTLGAVAPTAASIAGTLTGGGAQDSASVGAVENVLTFNHTLLSGYAYFIAFTATGAGFAGAEIYGATQKADRL